MKIAIAGDSAGQALVSVLLPHLRSGPYRVSDLSPKPEAPEYYADTAARTAKALLNGDFDRAILVCGTGIGVCIAANKIPGIRAALVHDTYSAERAALSNNAQVLTMGARVIGPELAKVIVDTWLPLQFDPKGKSAANVSAIDALDH